MSSDVRRTTIEDRLRALSVVDPATGCWNWTGHKDSNGYGRISLDGRLRLAHRVSWMSKNDREIPSCIFVCHHCDNPSCINPDHLFTGSPRINNRDSAKKGRKKSGETNHNAVLTQKDADYIRTSTVPSRRLARIFEVGVTTIRDVKSGNTWPKRPGDGRTRPPEAARSPDAGTDQYSPLTDEDLDAIAEAEEAAAIFPALTSPSPDPRGRSGEIAWLTMRDDMDKRASFRSGPSLSNEEWEIVRSLATKGARPAAPATTGARAEAVAWRCPECGDACDELSPRWRWSGERWQHLHDGIGHIDCDKIGYANPACDPTAWLLETEFDGAIRYAEIRPSGHYGLTSDPNCAFRFFSREAAESVRELLGRDYHWQFQNGRNHNHKKAFNGLQAREHMWPVTAPPEVTHGAAIGGDAVADWRAFPDEVPLPDTLCIVLSELSSGELFPVIDEWRMQSECPVSFSTVTVETGYGWNEHDDEVKFWRPIGPLPSATASTRSDGGDVGRDAK